MSVAAGNEPDSTIEQEIAAVREHGFIVIPNLLGSEELDRMRDALRPYLRGELLGRNPFEGYKTERVYALVGRHKIFEDLVEHPHILALCDALLEPNYLLTASQAINIHPGETPQGVHSDDVFYRVPRPRNAISVSTIIAVDDFTIENGATQIIPGSHTWSDQKREDLLKANDFRTRCEGERSDEQGEVIAEALQDRLQDVTMAGGSVIFFLGTLLHRGGRNRSAHARLALSNQYCEPWARQQENYTLAIPRERARQMSPRVQALLGYSIHPPFMGHVNGIHPRRLLES